MAGKVINTILNLRDNMSSGLLKTARNMGQVDKEALSATRSVLAFQKKATSAIGSVAKTAAKAAAGGVAALTAGFVAMDSVTRDFREAQGKLSTAYEAAGYDAQTAAAAYREFYGILGDTDTAAEAGQLLAKLARSEEDVTSWTRIAAGVSGTFGDALPIEGLIEATNETVKTAKVTGVLADALNWAGLSEDTFNERLAACSDEGERNRLLMEALSGTYEGAAEAFYRNNRELVRARANQTAMSGVTAKLGEASQTAKNSLFQLLGVQTDGSLRAGSALAWLSERADGLMQKIQQWSQDGTVDRLAQQFDQGLAKGLDMAGGALQWVIDHGEAIQRTLVGVGSALALIKILKFASDTITAVKNVQTFLRVSSVFLATNPIYLGIMAAIAAGALLIANWDTVKSHALSLWEGCKSVFGGIRDSITGAFQSARDGVSGFFSWIGEKLSWLDETVESVPVLGTLYQGAKSVGGWVMDKLQGNALGTSYFSGGLTRVNERGGEILNLPSGTQIIPHDVSRRMGGPSIAVYVTVQGNVIGSAQYAESLGNIIVQRILRALDNT